MQYNCATRGKTIRVTAMIERIRITSSKSLSSTQDRALTKSEFLSKLLHACKADNFAACHAHIQQMLHIARTTQHPQAIANVIFLKSLIKPGYQAIPCAPQHKAQDFYFSQRDFEVLRQHFVAHGFIDDQTVPSHNHLKP